MYLVLWMRDVKILNSLRDAISRKVPSMIYLSQQSPDQYPLDTLPRYMSLLHNPARGSLEQ